MDNQLEEYIKSHSTAEDPLLEELFRQTHIKFVNPNMVSGHIQGKLLRFIALMLKPSQILEIGTFTGYSAICLASALEKNGKLLTIELNDELAEFSRSYFIRAGLDDKITQLNGDALKIIPKLNISPDMVYIDGDKREYTKYFEAIFPKLKPGGFILADNILWGEKVLDNTTRDPQTRGIIAFNEMVKKKTDIEKLVLPIRDGMTLIRKTT